MGSRDRRPDQVRIRLPRLGTGTYTVAWKAVSADTHPVHGAFVFSVGRATGGIVDEVLAEQATAPGVGVGFGVVRFAGLAGVLLALGSAALLLGASPEARRPLWLLVAAGSGLVVLASALGLVFQGAVAGGYGLLEAARPGVLSEVVATRFGAWWVTRAALAAVLLTLALVARRRLDRWLARVAGGLGLGLAVTVTAASHARAAGTFAPVADLAHMLAASVWGGGLAAVAFTLFRTPAEGRWPVAARLVPAFSRAAVPAVAVLIAAGTVRAVEEIGAWRGLWETTYGRLVLVKIALLLPLLALGAVNNRVAVPRLRQGIAEPRERRRFLRAVVAELGLVVAIVAVTAALVAEPPAKTTLDPSGPVTAQLALGPYELDLVVDPARTGPNEVHLYLLDANGRQAQVDEARLDASLPARSIGPLDLTVFPSGPGHFVVPRADFPLPGSWRLRITVRRGEFDQWEGSLLVPIRKDT